MLLYTIDRPGDGPTHVALAFAWAAHPTWPTFGGWLPGYTVLAGALCWLMGPSYIVPRLLNVMLGTLSVLLLYVAVRRIHGVVVGFGSALLLAVLPLHIGLSASGLTEPLLLFGAIGALWAVTHLEADSGARSGWLSTFLGFCVVGEMSRYESWIVVSLLAIYAVYKTRSARVGLLLVVALSAFPLAWSTGNYRQSGEALFGFVHSLDVDWSIAPVDAPTAARNLALLVTAHAGWGVLLAALAGVAGEGSASSGVA